MRVRTGFIALLIFAVIGAGVVLLRENHPVVEVSYVTSDVAFAPLVETVTATGTLHALVTVEVGSQLSGRIDALLVDFNDDVKKGQPVASLDRQSYEARLSEAVAALDMARASVDIKRAELERTVSELSDAETQIAVLEARRDGAKARYDAAAESYERVGSLAQRGLVASESLDEAVVEVAVSAAALREAEANLAVGHIRVQAARSNVARQQADLENGIANIPQREALRSLAQVELERTIIRSPIDGVVIKRSVSEGQTVAASLEAPTLYTIAQNLGEMELIARVDETDIGRIRIGQQASFAVDAYPGRSFSGEVVQIRKAPEIVQNVVTYPVVIRTANDDLSLLPGMTASIRIVIFETDPLLIVPVAALAFVPSEPPVDAAQTTSDGPTLWVLGSSGRPQEVSVESGNRDRAQIAVAGPGITAGLKVVTGEVTSRAQRSLFGLRFGF